MTQERAGAVPLRFEQNLGQNDEVVRLISSGQGFVIFLGTEGATLVSSAVAEGEPATGQENPITRIRFLDRNPQGEVSGFGVAGGRTHYYLGTDPAGWVTNVPNLSTVRHSSLYPGIDLMHRSTGGRLEFDFLLDPGAEPDIARFRLEGAGEPRVNRPSETGRRQFALLSLLILFWLFPERATSVVAPGIGFSLQIPSGNHETTNSTLARGVCVNLM